MSDATTRAGHVAALVAFLPRLRQIALVKTRGHRSDAEDLAQDVVVRVLTSLDSFQDDGSPRALERWAGMILNNRFIDIVRKAKVKAVDDLPVEDHVVPVAATQLRAIERRDLDREVRALPEKHRAPFLLFANGRSYDEISVQLAIPVGTVRSRLFRARAALRERAA